MVTSHTLYDRRIMGGIDTLDSHRESPQLMRVNGKRILAYVITLVPIIVLATLGILYPSGTLLFYCGIVIVFIVILYMWLIGYLIHLAAKHIYEKWLQ